MSTHVRIVGDRRADRLARAMAEPGVTVVARCHKRLRGPYTGVDTVLGAVLPDAARRWPELVEHHRVELLYGIPELEELIGAAPRTLASDAPFRERTRFFGAGMIRCMSQGVVTFLLEYARRSRSARTGPLTVAFEEVHAADPTTQEFIALLVRRADPALVRVIVSGTADILPGELETQLSRRAERAEADVVSPPSPARGVEDLVAAYVAADGISDDPAQLDAYRCADAATVARLHDQRADELEPTAGWGVRVGAIAYHREHGSDPGGAGSRALLAAQRHCVEAGFSATVVDLGLRGRAITDSAGDRRTFCEFTNQAAAALVPLDRLEESLELYLDLRRRYSVATVHMTSSYAIAMLYTRFLTPRDHEKALEWQNNARAIASVLPEARDQLVYGVFQDNALALIEMHRGNFERALALINAGIARLNDGLDEDQWVLHRSQLLYNRARLLAGLKRWDEAYADYTTLIDLDPYYTDYLSERARISRVRGDFDAALADYDHAVRLAAPFPELYYNRGTARAQAGDVAGALADYSYVLDMEPDDVDTRLSRAELLTETGDVEAAEADVDAGLALRPAEPRLLCMKGTIALERASLAEAVELFDRALALDSGYPAALVNRAVAHFQLGDHRSAIDDLTATLEIVGDDPDVLLNRGLAHEADGRAELAVADFDRALALPGADEAELLYERGRCLLAAGEHERALADLGACDRLGQHAAEIKQLLGSGARSQ